MIFDEGLEAVWARHARLARAVWTAFDAWGAAGPMELNVREADKRSHAVTAVRIGAPHGTALRTWVEEQAGLTLGIGLGMETEEDPKSDGFFRLGHMGHVNAQMVLGALATIEAGLTAIGVPHGKGAVEAAAGVIAEG
jgi:alanine-glyoxylate transaminase/serine-glyoxylate transaminase/serine-pyruvate transaminase